ncbi:MAG: bifunctional phosphoribosyl-AMP cyclohydrolase/phosphoribosyl-ATP diphosphatase HisIE [Deltaproteobacteria bacterium]|nr:MAG: bifunctional phosphoribosyl-AMP cyclohydrolase/phosphoribosyl-ATP diphosphatase HisIE [Deltaproteobacteria bacterium]TMQ28638.1 MAG: bifunctional phosphoribosyl-AMP cyclohydrolase/phosphoribosyl-ATP diphosphatase HisIE [Deltaproteobacteria bacterium]
MPVQPTYDERGLVPCIVQDATTDVVLMLAWMNAEALQRTRDTGAVHFWSRSRRVQWKKGETSGNTLAVVEIRIDCDLDAVLVRARPAGPTCHTGATGCFFHRDGVDETDDGPPPPILHRLAAVIEARRSATAAGSYTKSLLDAGMPKILAKIAEEHGELAAELPAGEDSKVIHETADLVFHVMVGLAARDIPIEAVLAELERRFGTSGHVEKAQRT